MARLAREAGLSGADGLDLRSDASIQDAWESVLDQCTVPSDELLRLIAERFRLPCANFDEIEPTAAALLPQRLVRKFIAFPLLHDDRALVVAVADPISPDLVRELGFAAGRKLSLRIAAPDEIRRAIDATYRDDDVSKLLLARVSDAVATVELAAPRTVEEVTADEVDSEPIVRLTNTVFQLAIEQGASDIHIQPLDTSGVVRFRVDGIMRPGLEMPMGAMARVISRIKVLSRLDITDRLRPQDGRAEIRMGGRKFGLRVSTIPTRRAEKAVMRILDRSEELTLSSLGFPEREMARIRSATRRRDGLLTVTGPTGSGKTTTLHGLLQELNMRDVNVVTVEDPVERELTGITQVQVEEGQGFGFAQALRAVLRQDPDIIVVGEIRDAETAAIASRAGLTGHLVFTTLHTTDALGALPRLCDLGVDPRVLAEVFRGSLAQRLLRAVCPDCYRRSDPILSSEDELLAEEFDCSATVHAVGCDRCNGEGYRGRIPAVEFVAPSPDLAELIASRAPYEALLECAQADGTRSLLTSALDLVRAGRTTLQEVDRVVGRPPAPVNQKRRTSPEASVSNPVQGRRILVVARNKRERVAIGELLEAGGFETTLVPTGRDALQRLWRSPDIDLVVLDMDRGARDGHEALAEIRGSKTLGRLPVVVSTDASDPLLEIALLNAGADDYIRKPLHGARFVSRLEAVLRRRLQ